MEKGIAAAVVGFTAKISHAKISLMTKISQAKKF
jgi:hypothetical protein